jgi:hypothetical protein
MRINHRVLKKPLAVETPVCHSSSLVFYASFNQKREKWIVLVKQQIGMLKNKLIIQSTSADLFSNQKLDVTSKWPLNKIYDLKTTQNDLKQRRPDVPTFSAPLMYNDWEKTTYKSIATSPPFAQLKPSSSDLYLPPQQARSQTSHQKSWSHCQDCYTKNSQTSPLIDWHDQLLQGPYATSFQVTQTTYPIQVDRWLSTQLWFRLKSTWMHWTNKLDQ